MSKFKVGVWVKPSGVPFDRFEGVNQITKVENNTFLVGRTWCNTNDLELWKSRVGEWCWYRDILCKVTDYDDRPYISYLDNSHYVEDYELEPFIGNLPSWVKE